MSGARRHAAYPPRPLLRPGVHVCRREDGRLQVGLDMRLAVTAPDTPEVHALLDGLRHGVPPPPISELTPTTARLCSALLDRGLVLDGDALWPALGEATTREARESLTAMFVEAGVRGGPTRDHRRSCRVLISHHRLAEAADRCQHLLATAGVQAHQDPAAPAQLVVHLTSGEPDRSLSDRWVSQDVPHLIVQCAEGIIRVGPFVVPGRTACLRCIDAHHTDRDPRRPLIVEQYAAAAPRDGLPEPIHHDLLDLAVIWAARDSLNWLDGLRPRSWSTTIMIDTALEMLPTPWSPHAGCGCTWASQLSQSG